MGSGVCQCQKCVLWCQTYKSAEGFSHAEKFNGFGGQVVIVGGYIEQKRRLRLSIRSGGFQQAPLTGLHLTFPDYIVIFGYFAVVLIVGLYFNKRQTASQDYFAGGHQISWWLAGISHYMSSFSAFTFIAYSQMAYTYGWVAITLFWMTTPACILGGLVFAKRWRRARVVTPVEFLERRFNAPLRQLFAWAGIPVKIFDDALKIFATALILSAGVGADLKTAIVVCGGITVTYTILGGLWALVITDYVQFVMKITAMLLLLPLAFWHVGGIAHAFQGLPPGFLHFKGGPYGWTIC